jgi:hypothetical protein
MSMSIQIHSLPISISPPQKHYGFSPAYTLTHTDILQNVDYLIKARCQESEFKKNV